LELQTDDEVAVHLLGVDGAAGVRLADDGAVDDLVVLDRAGPAGPVASVENGREFLVTRGEPRHRFLRADLADPDVAPPDLAAVRLELDRSRARQRLRPIPEVLHPGAVDGELVVQ